MSEPGESMAEVEVEQVDGCIQGHRPSLNLPTDAGGCVCLMCFVKLLSDSSAFLTHKLYAVSELRQALHGPSFSATFLHHHSHFVVSPLSEALALCRDETKSCLAKALMDLILEMCKLHSSAATDQILPHDPASLLRDFILHIILELSSSSGLSCASGQRYTLHVLGLLLDSYSKYENVMPDAIRSYSNFLINLVTGLELPGDQIRGEILFLLYKISSFEDGTEEILPYLSNLIESAVKALVKTESDDLRTNCIAFLSTLAQHSVISIRFQYVALDAGALPEHKNDFASVFAEAIKGSLISSDSDVQLAALQLLYYMCPSGIILASDLQTLVEEGIMDYLFEILRVCENMENIVVWSIRTLTMLLGAMDTFTQRFAIGLETINHVLERSVESALTTVQPDLLHMIEVSLASYPGVISCTRAEHLLHTLTAILKQHVGDRFGLLPNAFYSTCSTLVTLLKLPCISSINDVHIAVEAAVSSTFIAVSAADLAGLECKVLYHAVLLLKGAFIFSRKGHELADFSLAEALIQLTETILLPIFVKNLEFIEDEHTVCAALEVILLMLDQPSLPSASRLADTLAAASWFSLSYELMARFPTQMLKDASMNLFGHLICRLEKGGLDENIKAQFMQLPSDPQDLLVLLALCSFHDHLLKLSQFAIIKILYFSQLHGDWFAKEGHILACLEQYLLLNFSTLSQGSSLSCIIQQLLFIYVLTTDKAISSSITYSLEAENLLASLIEHCQHDILLSNMHKNVFTWLIRTESLESYMVTGMLEWIKTFDHREQFYGDAIHPRVLDDEARAESLNLFLVALEADDCCGALFNRLLDEVFASQIEEDIKIVTGCYIKFVKLSALVANQLCIFGIVSNIRSWLAIYGARLPGVHGCLFELLYQLLCAVDCDKALDEESWVLLANQFVYASADKLNGFAGATVKEEVFSLLSLLSLIVHKSIENTGFLAQASGVILANEQLQSSICLCLANAGAQGPKLSSLDAESSDGKLLGCTLAFHLLCLRCAINMLSPAHRNSSLTQPFIQSLDDEPPMIPDTFCNSLLPKSFQEMEHLCRMLYFGTKFLKVLSSACLAEAFYWLTQTGSNHLSRLTAEKDKYSKVLQSIVMVLQGSMLDSCEFVQRNSSFCLYFLLTDTNLSSHEQESVYGSPWHRFLLEEFILSLTACQSAVEPMLSTIHVAIGFLKIPSPPEWIRSLFSPLCMSAIISSLTPERIMPSTVALLKELHSKGYLEAKHLEAIHKTLQTSRKIAYEDKCNVDDVSLHQDQRHSVCSSYCRQDSDAECLLSYRHLVKLAVSYWVDPLTSVQHGAASTYNSMELVRLIDEFLQEANSFSQEQQR